jgi:eukaryotic-like serine/threonine-protein kinase
MGRLYYATITRYRILNLLGKGAMGEVYRVKDIKLRRFIAMKVLSQAIMSPQLCDCFEQEARIAAQLGDRSLHIVRVHDFGVDEADRPFYMTEYLEGTSISSALLRIESHY